MTTSELLDWFRQQNEGIRTYSSLREMCAKDARSGAPDAALRQLLVTALDSLIDRYYGEPFPAEVAHAARETTMKLLEQAAAYAAASEGEKVKILDALAFRTIAE
ncbi:hypothetical protein QNA08_17935 [Chelatococcus sp. SYSU_G07232]|uniref:Uncharacterized protein n=1 Tax=Chelatococcus albus TaxID=3047466 RepID=A0ABT7AL45_9HYPH|nr:hypothetical protein [Chelatococcus sp. SYSU_G07232]MDJ1160095.1 hypothetical protein [Chelatococcus sp. SYSU_G07232]